MKMIIVPFLAGHLFFSCSLSSGKSNGEKTVEGRYVVQSKGEFSVADDTLAISPVANRKDIFSIERSVGFQRITEKGTGPKERKQEKTTAIWDAESGQLREQKIGRVYFLSADGSQLVIGSTAYTKISGR
jgi:hypothetical protein